MNKYNCMPITYPPFRNWEWFPLATPHRRNIYAVGEILQGSYAIWIIDYLLGELASTTQPKR